MSRVTITVVKSRGTTTFKFTTAHGVPRVRGIVVLDAGTKRHCWLIKPGAPGGHFNATLDLQERLTGAGLSIPAGVDPIEDLSPLDPRYRIAERQMIDAVETAQPRLGELTYGVLPDGFYQVLPNDGGAVPLQSKHKYEILLVGPDEATFQFEAA